MVKKYKLLPASLNEGWDSYLNQSLDSSVFVRSSYLKNIGCRIGLYQCYNANELRALIAVAESEDGASIINDDLLVYGGIYFGAPSHGQGKSQLISERHEISTYIARELAERYKEIKFCLAPSVDDVRAFQWYNYGISGRIYKANVRYTSYVSIADFKCSESNEDIELYREATGARRQQIRYSKRDKISTSSFEDVGLFLDFYRRTMGRQGRTIPTSFLDRMYTLLHHLLKDKIIEMYISRTADGVPASIAIFALEKDRAYYLFGASDPEFRNTSAGTAVLWDAFKDLSIKGVNIVDLEGVNSPKRGWFKLSFGGALVPYYEIEMTC